jgi:hypothetical protein
MYTLPSICMSTFKLVSVEKCASPDAKEVDAMCSNCSSDDPKPESFALFDLSSPKSVGRFADANREKRKRYGTSWFFAKLAKAALTLAIRCIHRRNWRKQIIGSVDRGSFVNLNLGTSHGEYMAKSQNVQDAGSLVEIRVSGDAIIEVFANHRSDGNTRNVYGLSEREYLSAWEESYAERSNLQRMLSGFRKARRLKYAMACGAFLTAAALAVWCAIR